MTLDEAKIKISQLKDREDRLWNTLMAMSAAMRGSDIPPFPDITKSYYPSFVTEARAFYQQLKEATDGHRND